MLTLKNKIHFCWKDYFGLNIWDSWVKLMMKWKGKIVVGFRAFFSPRFLFKIVLWLPLFHPNWIFSFKKWNNCGSLGAEISDLICGLEQNPFITCLHFFLCLHLFPRNTISVQVLLLLWHALKCPKGRSFKSVCTACWLQEILEFPHMDGETNGPHSCSADVRHDGSVTKPPWWESPAWH